MKNILSAQDAANFKDFVDDAAAALIIPETKKTNSIEQEKKQQDRGRAEKRKSRERKSREE